MKDLVVVERMPIYLCESHDTAGNWGRYPHNGAERVVMHITDAEIEVSDDIYGYAHIVPDADPSQYMEY